MNLPLKTREKAVFPAPKATSSVPALSSTSAPVSLRSIAASASAMPSGEVSIGDLFGRLAQETGELVRQEVTLASTETVHKLQVASKHMLVVHVARWLR